MKHVKKSVLLWYSAREIYDLVTAVTDYPRFLPWCDRAEVLEMHDDGMTARLHLHYHGVRHAFTTRNTHVPGDSVLMALVDGPFSRLEGSWRFIALGTPAGADESAAASPAACKIEFDLRYAFNSTALEAVVSPVFDRIAHTFVDAFVKRAEQVYGPR
ncbi:type II toxin-antitoxin system RatA family toxin [Caldimonas sp. KR1-144]|uniref:type II toxin-antitoxin system RatA family toxin n=1 Tax=Caldimonas sp. KR1-144 TaxID=3400911 RepID=UPI003C101170